MQNSQQATELASYVVREERRDDKTRRKNSMINDAINFSSKIANVGFDGNPIDL